MKILLIFFLLACSNNTEQIDKLTVVTSSNVKDLHNAYWLSYCSEEPNPQGVINDIVGGIRMHFDNPLKGSADWVFTLSSQVDTVIHIQIYYNNRLIVDYSGFPDIVELEVDLMEGTYVISKERAR